MCRSASLAVEGPAHYEGSIFRPRSNRKDEFPVWAFLRGLIGWRLLAIAAFWVVIVLRDGPLSLGLAVFLVPATGYLMAGLLASLRPPPPARLSQMLATRLECHLHLEGGESVERDDLVHISENFLRNTARLCRMILTDRRVVFLPAELPVWYRPLAYLLTTRGGSPLTWPLTEAREYRFEAIRAVTAWRPRFSGAPAIQLPTVNLTFQLINEQVPWQTPAPEGDVEAHFEQVERRWNQAKPGVG